MTSSLGPTRVFATGGIRFWKDREVPDVMLATLDYPEATAHPAFNVLLRVNFKSSMAEESFGVKFIGSDGVMTATSFTGLTLDRTPRPDPFDYTINSFADAMQKQLTAEWKAAHPEATVQSLKPDALQTFDTSSQNAHLDHHKNFYRSIRENKPSIEDATFGLRAAGPALLTNDSYFNRRAAGWNPVTMTEVKA